MIYTEMHVCPMYMYIMLIHGGVYVYSTYTQWCVHRNFQSSNAQDRTTCGCAFVKRSRVKYTKEHRAPLKEFVRPPHKACVPHFLTPAKPECALAIPVLRN